jgi:hypothetical protein
MQLTEWAGRGLRRDDRGVRRDTCRFAWPAFHGRGSKQRYSPQMTREHGDAAKFRVAGMVHCFFPQAWLRSRIYLLQRDIPQYLLRR